MGHADAFDPPQARRQLIDERREDEREFRESWRAANAAATAWPRTRRWPSRGGTFCYLKLDGSQGLDIEKFADKGELEDAIDAVLEPAGLGCQIGGGTGRRYSHIDLALTERERGLLAVCERLAAGKRARHGRGHFSAATSGLNGSAPIRIRRPQPVAAKELNFDKY